VRRHGNKKTPPRRIEQENISRRMVSNHLMGLFRGKRRKQKSRGRNMEINGNVSKITPRAVVWCLSAMFVLLVPVFIVAQDTTSSPDAGASQDSVTTPDPPTRVARLAQPAGQVSVEPAGVDQWTAASDNYPLTIGDRLYVDEDGQVELQLAQTVVRAWHYTDLSVTNLTDGITQFGLAQGSLHVRTFGLAPGHIMEVDTPNGAITVVQPGDLRIDCYTGDGGTVVAVKSGAVELSGPGVSESLGSGQSVRLMGANPITATALATAGKDPFDAWSRQRDRQMLSSQTREYVNPDTIGSDDLDQYGTWSQSVEYGPIWYPNAVPADWVPYSTGRWVWVSPWGWTWVDTYAWGFAPFHYGRWTSLGSRWGWVPGPLAVAPVYSPALVGFVGGADFSADGVGLSAWFPLGPGEPFYPWYPCSPEYFTRVNVTNIGRSTINRADYYRHYHDKTTFDHLRYLNRNVGTIAVHTDEFASGRPITPHTAIRPSSQQIARAQIIPHPFIQPTANSVVPRPVNSVPVPAQRANLVTLHGEQRPAPGGNGVVPNPDSMPAAPPSRTPQAGFNAGPVHNNIAPLSSQNLERNPQSNRPTSESSSQSLISRTPSPAPRPTFQQRQPALSGDPGRPLGSGQENNLIQGRPAGPSRTPEFPPHPNWAPHSAVSAPRVEAPRRDSPRR
jgi:hypothetical protein